MTPYLLSGKKGDYVVLFGDTNTSFSRVSSPQRPSERKSESQNTDYLITWLRRPATLRWTLGVSRGSRWWVIANNSVQPLAIKCLTVTHLFWYDGCMGKIFKKKCGSIDWGVVQGLALMTFPLVTSMFWNVTATGRAETHSVTPVRYKKKE